MNAFALIGSTITSTARLAFFALGACVFAGLLFAGHGLWRVLPLAKADPPAFAMRSGELGNLVLRREMKATGAGQHIEGLRFGSTDGADEALSLTVAVTSRDQPAFARPMPSLNDVARRDPETRHAMRTGQPRRWELSTRHGLLDAADVTLDIGGRRRNCVAFRSRHDGPLYIEGRHCPEPGVSAQPTRAACLVHALRAVRPLHHPHLDPVLARADASPVACTALAVGGTDFLPRRRRS